MLGIDRESNQQDHGVGGRLASFGLQFPFAGKVTAEADTEDETSGASPGNASSDHKLARVSHSHVGSELGVQGRVDLAGAWTTGGRGPAQLERTFGLREHRNRRGREQGEQC